MCVCVCAHVHVFRVVWFVDVGGIKVALAFIRSHLIAHIASLEILAKSGMQQLECPE